MMLASFKKHTGTGVEDFDSKWVQTITALLWLSSQEPDAKTNKSLMTTVGCCARAANPSRGANQTAMKYLKQNMASPLSLNCAGLIDAVTLP
jgi:hypothetical protein